MPGHCPVSSGQSGSDTDTGHISPVSSALPCDSDVLLMASDAQYARVITPQPDNVLGLRGQCEGN